MISTDTGHTTDCHDSLSLIANDLEVAGNTVASLMKLAERTLAAEEAGVETLIQVAGRYASDISLITQRLIKLTRT
ncbi:hypothetical protein [Herbaspirillum sp. VT-16-41]|uniref:hypothetical protein n=1 Tax=Herbaspirillum sp. VT-16-41 TaxID=1953765 RepID=UPI000981ECB4|nr:hypothetical protein [Herbaspirillum sp. VT-16-41]ONN64804.1 hypothetical protein BTM36_22135 [Herbaspirillum sp. VT-16-41]